METGWGLLMLKYRNRNMRQYEQRGRKPAVDSHNLVAVRESPHQYSQPQCDNVVGFRPARTNDKHQHDDDTEKTQP
jgi:hypothetical protein